MRSPSPRRARRPRRVRRLVARAAAVGAGAVLLLVLLLVASAHRDPTAHFLERRSHLADVREGPEEVIDGHRVREVRLTAASGLQVELLLKRPVAPAAAPRPVAMLLGGHNTGRDAVHLIPDTRGALVAALAYPYRGEHRLKGLAVLRHVPAIRAAILDTPPALMLAADYLLAQPDVDPRRLEVVGVSLGAPFAVVAGALDPRFSRVWAVHGSGGAYEPLEHNLRRSIPAAAPRAAVAGLASLLVSGPRMAPERWVDRIAPRPFVMINALHDERIPRPLVHRLYASADEPKSLVWLQGGHVRSRPEVVRPLVDTVLARMLAAPSPDSAPAGILAAPPEEDRPE